MNEKCMSNSVNNGEHMETRRERERRGTPFNLEFQSKEQNFRE